MRVIDKIKEMSTEELFDFLWKYILCESELCEKCKLVNTFVDDCNEWCHYIQITETYKRWLEMDYDEMVEKTKKYWGK